MPITASRGAARSMSASTGPLTPGCSSAASSTRSALGIAPARRSPAPRVGTDQLSRSACERSLPLELCRLGAQPIEVQVGQLGLRVDDHHVQTGDGQDPGDAAAPVTGTDHGDLGDLSSHDGHTPRP